MPEYPDLTVYVEALEARIVGAPLEKIRIQSPSLLKSVEPRPGDIEGMRVAGIRRMGKRLVFELEDEIYAVLHLMIAGRLHWKERGVAIPRKRAHAAFDFVGLVYLIHVRRADSADDAGEQSLLSRPGGAGVG